MDFTMTTKLYYLSAKCLSIHIYVYVAILSAIICIQIHIQYSLCRCNISWGWPCWVGQRVGGGLKYVVTLLNGYPDVDWVPMHPCIYQIDSYLPMYMCHKPSHKYANTCEFLHQFCHTRPLVLPHCLNCPLSVNT